MLLESLIRKEVDIEKTNMKRINEFLRDKVIVYKDTKCYLELGYYSSKRIYLELRSIGGNVFISRITLDTPHVPIIENMFILKSYLENKGIYEALLKANVILPCERMYDIGNNKAHICFLNIPPLSHIEKEQLN